MIRSCSVSAAASPPWWDARFGEAESISKSRRQLLSQRKEPVYTNLCAVLLLSDLISGCEIFKAEHLKKHLKNIFKAAFADSVAKSLEHEGFIVSCSDPLSGRGTWAREHPSEVQGGKSERKPEHMTLLKDTPQLAFCIGFA